jgi:hypothetical protein
MPLAKKIIISKNNIKAKSNEEEGTRFFLFEMFSWLTFIRNNENIITKK